MSGFLREEHVHLQNMTREFVDKEIIPIVGDIDNVGGEIPDYILKKMGELGFFGITAPEEYGGAGMDTLALAVTAEELSRGWLSVGCCTGMNTSIGKAILHGGTPSQKDRYLRKLATGEWQSCSAGTEPEAGSDAANLKTTAVKKGNKYIINDHQKGETSWISKD